MKYIEKVRKFSDDELIDFVTNLAVDVGKTIVSATVLLGSDPELSRKYLREAMCEILLNEAKEETYTV